MIVHFGHSCFSTKSFGKPIVYVLPQANCSFEKVKVLLADLETAYIYCELDLLEEAVTTFKDSDRFSVGVIDSEYITLPKF